MNRLLILPKMWYLAARKDYAVWHGPHYPTNDADWPTIHNNYESRILLGLRITIVNDVGRALRVDTIGNGTWSLTKKSHLLTKIKVLND